MLPLLARNAWFHATRSKRRGFPKRRRTCLDKVGSRRTPGRLALLSSGTRQSGSNENKILAPPRIGGLTIGWKNKIRVFRQTVKTRSCDVSPDALILTLWAFWICWAVILSVALSSLYFFYSRGLTNIYGDAIAHMAGARLIFDSLTPGYSEIGSAWLPLFHLLAAPLAINDHLWKTGLGGSLVSTAAFVLTGWFLLRLGLEMNRNVQAGVVALAAFLLCPNMLYLAATPLTEPLTMFWYVLVVYGLFRFQEKGNVRTLVGSAVAAFWGTLTRYDLWYLLPFAALFVLLVRPGTGPCVTKGPSEPSGRDRLRHAVLFLIIAGAGPILWLAHNAYRFGNPLEFYMGPYSAQAIYAHQVATTGFRYPTDGSLLISARYYLEDCKLVIGVWPLELAILGLVAWAADRAERARRSAALLLLIPLPFYVHAMAHAAVPIYVPTLFPHSYYNLRYGLEMLPAVAIFPSFLLTTRLPRRVRHVVLVVVLGTYLGQAISIASAGVRELAVVKEAILNTPCRSKRRQAVIHFLRKNYDGQAIVTAAGKWLCVIPDVGIPFRKTLTETSRKQWNQLRSGPPNWIGWIIRGDGDSVDELMRAYPQAFRDFELVERLTFPGEGSLEIYRRRPRIGDR